MHQCPNDYHDSKDLYYNPLINNTIDTHFNSLESYIYAQFVIERYNICIRWPINNSYDNISAGMQLILANFDVDRFDIFTKG